MANSQHKYLLERGWSQQQIDEVIRKAHEWLRGAGYTPLTEQGHWNGMMGSTQSYHLVSREKDARGIPEAFVEMLKGGKILDASRVHKFSRPGAKAAFGHMRDTKGRGPFTLQYISSSLYGQPTWLLVDKAGKTVAAEDNEKSANEMLRKANAGEPVYVSSRPGAKARFKVEDRFYFGKGRKERFELSFNRSEVERAKSELQSLVQVHRRLADKAEGVKAAKHRVVADVLARLVNQGPEVLAAVGFRKASYWNGRAMELANASSSGYGPILKTLVFEAEREYRSH